MKILLITPPANIIEDRSEIKLCAIPLGMAYIAAALEKQGHEVRALDTLAGEGYLNETKARPGFIRYGLSSSEIERRVAEFMPDIVGISALHSNRIYEVRETTEAVKKVSKSIVTVVGGGFPSIHPHECLSDPNCDYIVMGEGEATAVELVDCIKKKAPVSGVKGVGWKDNGVIRLNPRREPINDLDAIAFPAYHLLDMEEYFKIEMRGARYGRRRYALFCGSRGCPNFCNYCAKPLLVGDGYRVRSIANMMEEIEFLKSEYAIEELRFVDYHAMANIKRWKEFCRELIRRNTSIEFSDPHGMAVNSLDDEVLELMREAGCKNLYISIESADQEYLDTLKKGVDLGRVERIVSKARALRYHITAYFIIGIPGQSWKAILDTVEYAKQLDIDDVDFFIANAFPGSGLFDYCMEQGLIRDADPARLKYSLSNIKSDQYTTDQLQGFRRKAWFDFMFHKQGKRNAKGSVA